MENQKKISIILAKEVDLLSPNETRAKKEEFFQKNQCTGKK